MNIIELINAAGLKFVDFAMPMLIQSSMLIAILLLAFSGSLSLIDRSVPVILSLLLYSVFLAPRFFV